MYKISLPNLNLGILIIVIFRTRNPWQLKLDYNSEMPSFFRQEFNYISNALLVFLEVITLNI